MSHLAALLIISVVLPGQPREPANESNSDTAARIANAIRHLGDERFAVREQATQELWRMGLAAEEALEEAAKSQDAEVAARAKGVLDKVSSGIFVDTPMAIRQLAQEYHASDSAQRRYVLEKIKAQNQPLMLLLLITREGDRKTRQSLAIQFDDYLRTGILDLIIQGDHRRAEAFLAFLAEHENESGQRARDYAAFLLSRGRLDDAVAKLKAPAAAGSEPAVPRLLSRLLQVQGNLREARAAADSTSDRYLQADIYNRLEDWPAILERDFIPQGQAIETLGFRAAYERLAGDQDRFQRTITKLHDERPESAWMSAEALMINGCWSEALSLLDDDSPVQAFDLRCRQGRFGEAFAQLKIKDPRDQSAAWLAEKASAIESTSSAAESLFALGLRMAQALQELGEREEAEKLVAKLEAFAGKDRGHRLAQLFIIRNALGQREQALLNASQALQDLPGKGQLFYHLYGNDGQYLAHEWWRILREQSPAEDAGITFARLKSLLNPQEALHPGLNLAETVAHAEQGLSKLKVEQRTERLQAMGKVCGIRGSIDLAVACFEKQAAAAEQIKESEFQGFYPTRKIAPLWYTGDAYALVGEWRKAAVAYDRAWQLDKHNAATLYLHGFALKKGGDAKGLKFIDLALLMPLADTVKRRELAEIMERQGEKTAALAQQELILRLGAYEGWEGSEDWAVRDAAGAVADYVEAANPLRAASLRQRAILYLLKTNTGYSEAGEYAVAVHQIHRGRAIGLLQSGRVAEAITEMKVAQRARPGDVELVLQALPLLTTARRDAEAAALLATALEALEGVCRDFPQSASHRRELARLRTGRGHRTPK